MFCILHALPDPNLFGPDAVTLRQLAAIRQKRLNAEMFGFTCINLSFLFEIIIFSATLIEKERSMIHDPRADYDEQV